MARARAAASATPPPARPPPACACRRRPPQIRDGARLGVAPRGRRLTPGAGRSWPARRWPTGWSGPSSWAARRGRELLRRVPGHRRVDRGRDGPARLGRPRRRELRRLPHPRPSSAGRCSAARSTTSGCCEVLAPYAPAAAAGGAVRGARRASAAPVRPAVLPARLPRDVIRRRAHTGKPARTGVVTACRPRYLCVGAGYGVRPRQAARPGRRLAREGHGSGRRRRRRPVPARGEGALGLPRSGRRSVTPGDRRRQHRRRRLDARPADLPRPRHLHVHPRRRHRPRARLGPGGRDLDVREELAAYGAEPDWFGLGDRDIATHLVRTQMLRAGYPLSEVTAALCHRWQPGRHAAAGHATTAVETHVVVDDPATGPKARKADPLPGVVGAPPRASCPRTASPPSAPTRRACCPRARDAIAGGRRRAARAVQPGRVASARSSPCPASATRCATTPARVVGLSPIVGGRPLRGMADACLAAIGVETTAEARRAALRRPRRRRPARRLAGARRRRAPTSPASRSGPCRC